MQQDRTHLNALELRLSHERVHAANDRTPQQKQLRAVWIAQVQREIAQERRFLGLPEIGSEPTLSDDELFAALATSPA